MDNIYVPLILEVIDCIEANIKNRSVAQELYKTIVADHYWFPTVFSVSVGKTFDDYLIARVLSHSAHELVDTRKSVTEIAKEYKFGSQQTYSNLFASVIGTPPHVFRTEKNLDGLTEVFVPDSIRNSDLDTSDVVITELPPMTVVSISLYKSNSRQSKVKMTREILEPKVWSKLIKWQMTFAYYHLMGNTGKNPGISKLSKMMVAGGYHLAPVSRFFGFSTTFNSVDVGYEAWSMMNYPNHEIFSDDKDIEVKHFDGGLYIILEVPENKYSEISNYWLALHKWILNSGDYTYGDHQYLEEYITVPGKGGFHGKKLYMPIKKLED